jgi:hypothetical protein
MSEEPRKPEDLLANGRALLRTAAIILPIAAVLYAWHLERGSLLEMLRMGLTTSGLIFLVIGLLQLYAGRSARH